MPGRERASVTTETVEIRSEDDLDRMTSELCRLMSLGEGMSSDEDRRFRALTVAVERYELIHHPIDDPSHAALLAHLLEAKGSSQAELAKATGINRHRITAILHGTREINDDEANILSRYFHVEPSLFTEPAPSVSMKVVGKGAGTAGLRVVWGVVIEGASTAKVKEYARGLINSILASPGLPVSALAFESKSKAVSG
jgi:HTH-type transcriptional regulator/antitoxin HigA